MLLQELLDAPVFGNAMSDGPLLDELHDYLVDETNDIEDRVKVLRKFDSVAGIEEEVTAADVHRYVEYMW